MDPYYNDLELLFRGDAGETPRAGRHLRVAVLRGEITQGSEDVYVANVIKSLQDLGHEVSLYTSRIDRENALDTGDVDTEKLNVVYSAWWFPKGVGRTMRRIMFRIRSLLMAFRLVVEPPRRRPQVVVLDVDLAALFLLRCIGFYRTVYIHHFPQLICSEYYHCSMRITTDLVATKGLSLADEVIVQTKCLENVLRRSYPNTAMSVTILPACCDTGLWTQNPTDVRRIVPDLPDDYILFVVFGEYRKKTNLKLVLEAIEQLDSFVERRLMDRIHLVIAGHSNSKSLEQKLFYTDLVSRVTNKPYASNVTFLQKPTTVQTKTLIEACTALLQPTRHDVFEGSVLAAMCAGKPVVSVDCGFASDVLTHRLTGVLIPPDSVRLAKVMAKLANSSSVCTFIGDMARANFEGHYSFERFTEKLERVVERASGLQDAK